MKSNWSQLLLVTFVEPSVLLVLGAMTWHSATSLLTLSIAKDFLNDRDDQHLRCLLVPCIALVSQDPLLFDG